MDLCRDRGAVLLCELVGVEERPQQRGLETQGGLRLDEVVTKVSREPGQEPIPAAYQRLLMGGRFPDNSLAMIAVVDRSEMIRIPDLSQHYLDEMPQDGRSSYNS